MVGFSDKDPSPPLAMRQYKLGTLRFLMAGLYLIFHLHYPYTDTNLAGAPLEDSLVNNIQTNLRHAGANAVLLQGLTRIFPYPQ